MSPLVTWGLLGVLVISSEYGTGMIRASLTAVPQRKMLLAAKIVLYAVTALLVGVLSCVGAFFLFQALLTGPELSVSISDPGVARAVVGGGLYLTVLGLLGLGLGAAMRSSGGAIAVLFGLIFVPSLIARRDA